METKVKAKKINQKRPKVKAVKSLQVILPKTGGRGSRGQISVRHIGGRHKRLYRKIDFKRNKFGITAKVAAFIYDPNRNTKIALLHYIDGEKRYILGPEGLEIGDKIISG